MASGRSSPPTVSYHAASFIMRSLTSHCPKIEKLGLFPESSDGEHAEDGESSLLAFLSGDNFYEYASILTSLKHLTGTFAWFKVPALQILGQLPHLESIAVYGADDADYEGSELTEDLFPTLQSLTLHRSNCFNTLETLGATQVIKNLTLLHVTLDICAGELDADDNTWLMEEFFPLLLNTPRLADLKINAHANYVRDDNFVIGESVLRIFQGLPGLKRLHLDEVYLSDEALQFDLASAWPSVTHLKLPGHAASLASLSRFASLPELYHLELQMELYDPTREYDTTLSPLMVLEASFGSAICSKFEEMDRVLHALLNTFPELTRVVWADDPLSRLADQHTIERAGFLNGYLATLRELRALKKLSAM
ncbi:hypothetical protein FRC09_009025 [Ceratobasidium sp. 395]|nr:hypothetical protein FRC09_009025 [Ceratobasidium sp. 395]